MCVCVVGGSAFFCCCFHLRCSNTIVPVRRPIPITGLWLIPHFQQLMGWWSRTVNSKMLSVIFGNLGIPKNAAKVILPSLCVKSTALNTLGITVLPPNNGRVTHQFIFSALKLKFLVITRQHLVSAFTTVKNWLVRSRRWMDTSHH